jgi:hypothetical protein
METIKITLSNTKLQDTGLDSPDSYTNFYFNRKDLLGYWIDTEDDEPVEFVVYIGAHKFTSPYSVELITKLNKILTENSKL